MTSLLRIVNGQNCAVDQLCVRLAELYFSILQRKVLTPAVAASLVELTTRILNFEATMRGRPKTIDWQFNSTDFDRKLADLAEAVPLAA